MSDNNTYEGLVVATVKVTPIEGTNKCTFTDASLNDEEKATFLKDIVMKPGGKPREFEATIVDPAEAKQIIDAGTSAGSGKPLFCIHGFNNEPSESLFPIPSWFTGSFRQAIQNFGAEKKFFPIPVVWACLGGRTSYFQDREVSSINAGKALRTLVNSIEIDFPEKSLLAHSMGNRVLGVASLESLDAKLDNIFMVAADVPHDTFHANASDDKKKKAKNIFSMLSKNDDGKPKGKISILHNQDDWALFGSGWGNWESRIGCVGHSMKQKWGWFGYSWVYDESLTDTPYKGYIDNVNCNSFKMGDSLKHSYQYEEESIDIYEAKYV